MEWQDKKNADVFNQEMKECFICLEEAQRHVIKAASVMEDQDLNMVNGSLRIFSKIMERKVSECIDMGDILVDECTNAIDIQDDIK